MASDNNPVIYDYSPYFLVYKDGSVKRLKAEEQTPAGLDPLTNVDSKDIRISADVSAHIYLPPININSNSTKLSLILYFRGGGFCIFSSASPIVHRHLNGLTAVSSSIILSVDYRRAPEHHIPVQYDDCWAALEWVASHRSDAGLISSYSLKLAGTILLDPYFWGKNLTASEKTADPVLRKKLDQLWGMICPESTAGNDDPRVNPLAAGAPSLADLGCTRMLLCTSEKDAMRDRALMYYEALTKGSEWRGTAELYEAAGEDHEFYLNHPDSNSTAKLRARIAAFLT
ncbi:2-hydroxyisoflavanone dehydratase-like [Zingiber officinale]|uniref:2-hydroxyisoflavanone dehydratase-like n=1 Tax=Zingiber officinale TaxID=94328 RepID=UPI001C4CDE92|nr:2-hydroxyisoflavanone dehydratase-like [Zingiber officinale]